MILCLLNYNLAEVWNFKISGQKELFQLSLKSKTYLLQISELLRYACEEVIHIEATRDLPSKGESVSETLSKPKDVVISPTSLTRQSFAIFTLGNKKTYKSYFIHSCLCQRGGFFICSYFKPREKNRSIIVKYQLLHIANIE